ncbi:MAG: hypothetical protein KME46_20620 [Brasilonema angustatum HA4187-MV1]|jgi:hypothetical protein|nr:hypothetical protein [Brasilonema angustatum HA4187-MV1]
MDSLNGDSKSRSLEDLQSGANNSEDENILELSVLSDTIELIEKIITKISQSAQTGAQSENTQHKASVTIRSLELNYSERPEMEETLELLCEQVESFKQLLYYKELELQEIQQELRDTNEDLLTALNSPCLTLNSAKKLVKEILVSKKPIIGETLATLLSAIYNSTVEPQELEQKEKSNSPKLLISAPGNCMPTNNQAYQIQSVALRKQATENRAKSQMVREQSPEIRAKSRKLQAQFSENLAKSIELKAQFMELGTKFIGSQASFMLREQNFRHTQKPKAIDLADVSPPDQLLDFGDSSCKCTFVW